MASTMHHISVGQLYYEKYLSGYTEEQRKRFLLGTIAVDWNAVEKKKEGVPQDTRKISHFVTNETEGEQLTFDEYLPNLDKFLEEYGSQLDDPFVLGYLVHLVTDKVWFEKTIPGFVKKHLKEINGNADNISELTTSEYLNWYRSRFYHDFDIHNLIIGAIVFGESAKLPNFLEFDLSDLPISSIDLELLQKFLIINYERIKDVNDITVDEAMTRLLEKDDNILVADLHSVSDFVNESVEESYRVILKGKSDINKKLM